MLTLTYLSISLSFRLALFHYHTLTIPVFCVSRRLKNYVRHVDWPIVASDRDSANHNEQ